MPEPRLLVFGETGALGRYMLESVGASRFAAAPRPAEHRLFGSFGEVNADRRRWGDVGAVPFDQPNSQLQDRLLRNAAVLVSC